MPHVINPETVMKVQRLLRLVNTRHCLSVVDCWKRLPSAEDRFELFHQVFEDMHQMLDELLVEKILPLDISRKAQRALCLQEG